jgi:hypothetical protein
MATTATSFGPGWFARTSVQTVVLGAFFFLTLPLAVAVVAWSDVATPWLPLYGVTFGLTHFLITGLLYLDSRNLRYFASTWTNRIVYFAVPLGILVFMDLLAVVPMGRLGDGANAFLFYFIMFANFLHVSRQSFGVLQLFKREASASFSPTLRQLENLFFLGLVTGQFVTFLRGEEYDASPEVLPVTGMVVLLFFLVLGMHLAALRTAARRGGARREDWVPAAHFTLQAVAGALVIWQTGLLQIALAMHYVEYHVAVLPRFFHAPVEPGSRIDRLRSWLGRIPLLFYAGLLMAAWGLWLSQRTQVYLAPDAAGLPMRLLVHSLDGIFLCHFFVEAFLWKFSKPHYRDTLGPLYFARRAV